MKLILMAHLFATLFMVGLIWFVQVVHYPLFGQVGRDQFAEYERRHQQLTTWVVGPVMLVELATAVALVKYPQSPSALGPWLGLGLLVVIWLSTWALQVPAHTALSAQFSEQQHLRLVHSNWIRTAAWTLRGILVLWLTYRSLPGTSE